MEQTIDGDKNAQVGGSVQTTTIQARREHDISCPAAHKLINKKVDKVNDHHKFIIGSLVILLISQIIVIALLAGFFFRIDGVAHRAMMDINANQDENLSTIEHIIIRESEKSESRRDIKVDNKIAGAMSKSAEGHNKVVSDIKKIIDDHERHEFDKLDTNFQAVMSVMQSHKH